jgi:hypothetical protein
MLPFSACQAYSTDPCLRKQLGLRINYAGMMDPANALPAIKAQPCRVVAAKPDEEPSNARHLLCHGFLEFPLTLVPVTFAIKGAEGMASSRSLALNQGAQGDFECQSFFRRSLVVDS